ncbi:MAG: ABC transporter permease [Clostridiaceae bacterium]|nr:ABC transporter permease [Clostridiaceae bacterium]
MKTVFQKIKENKVVAASMVFLILVAVFSIVVPVFSPFDYYSHDLDNRFLPPFSGGHLFGTDEFGRDLFVRVWEGARISLAIGVFAALAQTLAGIVYGGTSGVCGGLTDEILMRTADVVYSIPNLIVAIMLTAIIGSSEFSIILALSITEWTGMARVVRGQTLLLREMEFVNAARVLGAGKKDILIRHIIPNSRGPIMVNLLLSIPGAIFAESFLSFLGLGVKLPKASWGTLASDGYRYISSYPWLLFIPLAMIALTMISLNVLADSFGSMQSGKPLGLNVLFKAE